MRELQPCGTDAAYQRHKSHGEEPCEACKVARRAYKKSRNSKESAQRYYRAKKDLWKDYNQKRFYGISLDEKRLLLESQGGRCAIAVVCGGAVISLSDSVTEHVHNGTRDGSAVRGIACHRCNLLLGLLGDGKADLRRQFEALERYLMQMPQQTQRRLAAIRARKP